MSIWPVIDHQLDSRAGFLFCLMVCCLRIVIVTSCSGLGFVMWGYKGLGDRSKHAGVPINVEKIIQGSTMKADN